MLAICEACCQDEAEKDGLWRLMETNDDHITYADTMVNLFKSARPPIEQLLNMTPGLEPRSGSMIFKACSKQAHNKDHIPKNLPGFSENFSHTITVSR